MRQSIETPAPEPRKLAGNLTSARGVKTCLIPRPRGLAFC